jgi:2-haloacid dehalogenase
LWRAKQLEYSWTRTLMDRYADFWTLTQEALDFALARFPGIARSLRQPLLDAYQSLDAYADVEPALKALAHNGKRLALFTNGTRAMAKAAATSAGIAAAFEAIVSVDAIRQFKTDPEAYGLLHETLGLAMGEVALVSSNRWDVAGAAAFGMPAIWVNRTAQPDEYLDLPPALTVSSLSEL